MLTKIVASFLLAGAFNVIAGPLQSIDVNVAVVDDSDSFFRVRAESSDAGLSRSVERRLLKEVVSAACPDKVAECIASLPDEKGIPVRRVYDRKALAATVRREVGNCLSEWRKTVPAREWKSLENAIFEGDYNQVTLGEVAQYGTQLTTYITDHAHCAAAEATSELVLMDGWDTYWKLRETGSLGLSERREVIPGYRALFDGAVKAVRERHLATGGEAFRTRLTHAIGTAASFGWADGESIDDERLFDTIAKSRALSPAQLALTAFAAVPTTGAVSNAMRDNWKGADARPAIWLADVLLSRCRLANNRVNPSCSQSPERYFRWVNLKLDGHSANILWPTIFNGEEEAVSCPTLRPLSPGAKNERHIHPSPRAIVAGSGWVRSTIDR